ncbi:sigma-70 family RNA polymerase sigma factor [Pseudonocardia ailaonensis]|uniref:Sigma-70 family RNA polymerase sigma factor n=1 Tax=Pseudonocardia ailaonensis TaxID=367279 RepID=A0ABN2NDQ2_9PSEU
MSADPAVFDALRPHLLRVGYRVTGSLADAEDAVQDAWLRWSVHADEVRDPKAWLTTVVARIGLDRLTSAAARRESYVGPWLPEPLVTTPEDDGPLARVVRGEDVRLAALLVLETLSPAQRVALVLHDALDTPFVRIAEVLGCSEEAARAHASRARRKVGEAALPARVPAAAEQAVLAAFAEAMARGDWPAVVRLLHPDVVFTGDGGGIAPNALRPVAGADRVARLLAGLMDRYGPELDPATWRPVLVNGEPGFTTPATASLPASAGAFTVGPGPDGRFVVTAVWHVGNPEKLHVWW